MKRRGFLNALGLAFYSNSCLNKNLLAEQRWPVSSIQNHFSLSRQSIKVIGIGDNGNLLIAEMQDHLSGKDYKCDVDFISIQDGAEIFNARAQTSRLSLDVASIVQNRAAISREWVREFQEKIEFWLSGAQLVLLIVSLDSNLAFAVCDVVTRLARNSGALTIVQVGTPLVDDGAMGGSNVLIGTDAGQTAAAVRCRWQSPHRPPAAGAHHAANHLRGGWQKTPPKSAPPQPGPPPRPTAATHPHGHHATSCARPNATQKINACGGR